jgi:hypothetical protein
MPEKAPVKPPVVFLFGSGISHKAGLSLAGEITPVVLVGTHNKPRYYTSPWFEEQHWRLREALSEANRLVICGHSFGDKAINGRLLYWLNQSPERRAFLIHHDPEACRKNARAAIAQLWKIHGKNGQWKVIEKKMEEVSWSEVKAAMYC